MQLIPFANNGQVVQTILVATGAVAGSLLAALYTFQEKILYHPSIPTRALERNPAHYGMDYVDVEIETDDKVKLHAWLITQPQPRSKDAATFLYFHGNAGNISHRLPDVRHFHNSGFNVLMVSYRGYGQSDGAPSEHGIRKDALAALEYACDRSDVIDTSRIYLFGRSVGGACALALATTVPAQRAVRGVVVENTFTSIDDMIDVVFPVLSFAKMFNRNKWNSQSAVATIEKPILFISGERDELVPPDHMTRLHAIAKKAPFTSFHKVEQGGHNDTWHVGGSAYREAIRSFLRRVEGGE